MSGYYDEEGKHRCNSGHVTKYQLFSGGTEFLCPECGDDGPYPEGEGGPRARLLAVPDGKYKLRRMIYEEIARRKEKPTDNRNSQSQ